MSTGFTGTAGSFARYACNCRSPQSLRYEVSASESLAKNSHGADHNNFRGIEGGVLQQEIMAYACMICHSFVLYHGDEPTARERLLDVIPVSDIPAASQ